MVGAFKTINGKHSTLWLYITEEITVAKKQQQYNA